MITLLTSWKMWPTIIFITLLDFCTGCTVGCADLSGLQKAMPKGGFLSDDGTSVMGMCGDISSLCNSKDAFVASFESPQHNHCNAALAKWSPVKTVKTSGGFVSLILENGGDCPTIIGSKWTLNATFICDHSVDVRPFHMILSVQACTANLEMYTKYACNACSAKNDWNKNGLSGGSVFLIVLICCTFVYFAAGAFYMYKFQEARGMDMVPNKALWCNAFEWTKVGCMVSWNTSKELMARLHEKLCDKKATSDDEETADGEED